MTSKKALTAALFFALTTSFTLASAQGAGDSAHPNLHATTGLATTATQVPGESRAQPTTASPKIKDGRRLFLLFSILKPRG